MLSLTSQTALGQNATMSELTKTASTPSPAAGSPSNSSAATNYRWVICALLFWVTTANYIDRGVFGNLKPEMPGT